MIKEICGILLAIIATGLIGTTYGTQYDNNQEAVIDNQLSEVAANDQTNANDGAFSGFYRWDRIAAMTAIARALNAHGIKKFSESDQQASIDYVRFKLRSEIDEVLDQAKDSGKRTPQEYVDYFESAGWHSARVVKDESLNPIGIAIFSGVNPIGRNAEHFAVTYVELPGNGDYNIKFTQEVWFFHSSEGGKLEVNFAQPGNKKHVLQF